MNGTLSQKTAVVTGSSSGIGQAIAVALAEAGAAVIVNGRANLEGAQQTQEQCVAHGVPSQVIMTDLAKADQQQQFLDSAWQWRGGVDIWVNNAGVDVLTGPTAKLRFEEKLALLWQLDCLATIRLTREVGRRMKAAAEEAADEQRGRYSIINLGWDQAATGMEGESGEMFAAIKGAVMAFTRSAAKSLAPEVRVNCVAPGWIKTAWGAETSGYWDQRATGEAMLARWGTPTDVAAAVKYLASREASFVTGQTLSVNGGFQGSRD